MTTRPQRLLAAPAAADDVLARAMHAACATEPSQAQLDALQERIAAAAAAMPSSSPVAFSWLTRKSGWFAVLLLLGGGAYVATRGEETLARATLRPPSIGVEAPVIVEPMPTAASSAQPQEAKTPPGLAAPEQTVKAKKSMEPEAPVETRSELDLLRDAEASLRGNPAAALGFTQRHLRAYPQGVLAQERELLGVQALLGLGERSQAEARAAEFRVRFPASPLLRRLSRVLERDSFGKSAAQPTSTQSEVQP